MYGKLENDMVICAPAGMSDEEAAQAGYLSIVYTPIPNTAGEYLKDRWEQREKEIVQVWESEARKILPGSEPSSEEIINVLKYETNEIKATVDVAKTIAYSFDDQQALSVKDIFDSWENDPEGYEYRMDNLKDKRRTFKGRLWNLKKAHKKQSDWFPGAEGTLWSEIVEGHKGTIEDPIPVPDSVTISGFEYEYGKYYIESEVIYLAKRQGKEDGEKEILYFFPSALIGSYFEKITI